MDVRAATDQLIAAGARCYPVELPDGTLGPHVTAALTARCIGSAQAAVRLASLGREADLAVVARTLYEHAVTLGWLTGDVRQVRRRFVAWQLDDDEQRGKADREMSRLMGRQLLSDERRERAKADAEAAGALRMPGVADRAVAADKEWGPVFGLGGDVSMRAAYSTIYRMGSAMAHPTHMGLSPVTERDGDAGPLTVDLEPKGDVLPTLGVVPVVLAFALYVSSYLTGRPDVAKINAVFDGNPGSAQPSPASASRTG